MTEDEFYKIIQSKNEEISYLKKIINNMNKQMELYKKAAYLDSLTKLHNRRIIKELDDYSFLILGDIDYFKTINDTYGHDTGDKVLVEISNIFKEQVDKDDIVCRWGGEEFLILIKNGTEEKALEKAILIKKALIKLKSKFGFDVTMSFGVSRVDENIEESVKNADRAMYSSKDRGRNRVTAYSLNLK